MYTYTHTHIYTHPSVRLYIPCTLHRTQTHKPHKHAQLDLARRRAFPAVDVTYQMNLQSPGTALLPEPTKAVVQVI